MKKLDCTKKIRMEVNPMKLQSILFDMDDTLLHCNKYFELVTEQFVDQMETWFHGYGIKQQEIRSKQAELDVAAVHSYGFTAEHFPQSFVDTYEHFSDLEGRPKSKAEAKFLLKLGHSVYEQEIEAYPNMKETLTALKSRGHELSLYTGGVKEVQLSKVARFGLDEFFQDRIFIALHKNTEAMEEVLVNNGLDRRRTWMIGNSIRTDIVPALENGIHSIHIPAIHEWDYNNVDIRVQPRSTFLRLSSLHEVPEAIERHAV
jgi:putative hydrolase of the HAD superfamily